ncbi:MAG: hypothetical protein LWY06_18415 [Firmicutes bacterium]|nr:hypothetical protein [Bacillota bacterium]
MKAYKGVALIAVTMVLIAFIACSFMPVFARGNASDRERHGRQGRAVILEDTNDGDDSPTPAKTAGKSTPAPVKTAETPAPAKTEQAPANDVKNTDDQDDSGAPTPVKTVITPKPVSPDSGSTSTKSTPTPAKPSATPMKPVPSPGKPAASPTKPVQTPKAKVYTPAPEKETPAKVTVPTVKTEPDEAPYKGSHWDYFAKTVRFTVSQEQQLRTILKKERESILKLRQDAEARVFAVLDAKQKPVWEKEKQAAKKMGPDGFYKNQALINPLFLKTFIKITDAQHARIHSIFWEYTRQVGKIRRSNQEKIEKILMPEQLVKWEAATRHRR